MISLPFIYVSNILLIVGETGVTDSNWKICGQGMPEKQFRQKVEHSVKNAR